MTAAACPLCSRIAAGVGRPSCPLCHGTAAITLGPLAVTAGEPDDVMAHAVATAIRRGLDTTLEETAADDIDTTAALDEYAAGLRAEGYLADPDDVTVADMAAGRTTIRGRRLPAHDSAIDPDGIVVNIDHRQDRHGTGYAAGLADGLNRRRP